MKRCVYIALLCTCMTSVLAIPEQKKQEDVVKLFARILAALHLEQSTSVNRQKTAPLIDFTQKRSRATCPGCPCVDEW